MSLFLSVSDDKRYREHVRQFTADLQGAVIPVFTGNRPDLEAAIELAEQLYDSRRIPDMADVGIQLSSDRDLEPILDLLPLFAQTWRHVSEEGLKDHTSSLLVVGIYKDFTYEKIKPWILDAGAHDVSFLVARDMQSLSWLVAKQFVKEHRDLPHGLFTYKKLPDRRKHELAFDGKVAIYDAKSFERDDIQDILLHRRWNVVVFHGHGKEDNINLGDYTVCGRNSRLRAASRLCPRCGYPGQTCFKDEAKLIPLNELSAVEVVMASCQNGPFSDTAMYDEKFNLLLNAVDGPAQRVTAAYTIQDTDLTELRDLLRAIGNGIKHADVLNNSLAAIHPFTSMFHIGAAERKAPNPIEEFRGPDPLFVHIIERAHKYYINDFIGDDHPLKKLLKGFIKKSNQRLARGQRGLTDQEHAEIVREWQNKISPLNKLIATTIANNPNDALLDFEGYITDRSTLLPHTVRPKTCSCGNKGLTYKFKGLTSTVFDLEMDFCYRCGDKRVAMDGGPDIAVSCDTVIDVGGSLNGQCLVLPNESGEMFIGWYVPSYIAEYVKLPPKLHRLQARKDEAVSVPITIEFREEIPAQAYYFTVFAVQNLTLTVCRHFFNIVGEEENKACGILRK